jgi:hypothetical protein
MAVARRLETFGTDRGGMLVEVEGWDQADVPHRRRWMLTAAAGQGPFVPVLPAAIVAKRMTHGGALAPGARPALDLISIEELAAEAADLSIGFETAEVGA